MLFVRPRGWHLDEKHFLVDGERISGSLFDFGLYFFHNATKLGGRHLYFYLPKLESHLEAKLWNDVFLFAQEALGVPRGTIRATVLIETIYAAFEMHEILWELRDHSAGLNCGRWDYIFSFIKKLGGLQDNPAAGPGASHNGPRFPTCLRAVVDSNLPPPGDPRHGRDGGPDSDWQERSLKRMSERSVSGADRRREATAGHDGTWVAHPGLVPVAREVFDEHMKTANQIDRKREDVHVTRADLLRVHQGTITEAGVRLNADVGIRYLEAWLMGNGCVPIHNFNGGRDDGGDLPGTTVAMDPAWREVR